MPVVSVIVDLVVFLTVLNDFCIANAMCLGGVWYGFASSLTFIEKVLLKHPIPVNKLLNSLYIINVALVFSFLSVFMCRPVTR